MKLMPVMVALAAVAFAVFLILVGYVEISDPCVRYESRGLVATTYGNRTTIEPQQVCVERKSGWRER